MADPPLVGVVVVDYKGGARTLACVQRLHESAWPAHRLRVVVVDNAASEGSSLARDVATRWPGVTVVPAPANRGFSGGCNLGIAALRDVDYVALVNNDALPEPDWLEALVAALDADPQLGAVTPKVLLAGRFAEVRIGSATTRAGGGDPRDLGVQVVAVRADGVDVTDRCEFAAGFWGWEHDPMTVGGRFRWTSGEARLLVPVARSEGASIELVLACAFGARDVTVNESNATVAEHPVTVDAGDVGAAVDVINNVGTDLLADGSAVDIGFLEVDRGQFDEPFDVQGWSGAAVLLRQAYIGSVGGFDDRLFLYYEDTDLSWRGRLLGWRYRCVPASVVRHEHSATVGSSGGLVRHLSRRNRLVVLTKYAPPAMVGGALAELLRDITNAAWRDVVRAAAARRSPNTANLRDLVLVLGGYVKLLPHALRARMRARG